MENSGCRKMVIAISGVKNSGKTTCICGIMPYLKAAGLKVAVIKHDGHDFVPDVPGTDTARIREAGAYGTAIFSAGRCMVIRDVPGADEHQLVHAFPEADLILLEGFKHSGYPKIELIREGNSKESVCAPETLIGIATNIPGFTDDAAAVPAVDLDRPKEIAALILDYYDKHLKLKENQP